MESTVDKSLKLASIQSRAVEWITDAFIMGSVRQLIEYLEIPNLRPIGNGELVVGGVITILITFLYLCVLPAYLQERTPGKLLL